MSSDYKNSSDWGRQKAASRYESGGSVPPRTARERIFGDPKTTSMPKGPSDSYVPPSESDRKSLSDMAKKSGGRTHSDEAADRKLFKSMFKAEEAKEDREEKASGGRAHPGFKAVQSKIEGEGYSKDAAGAILGKSTREASKEAHKANPRLNRVRG